MEIIKRKQARQKGLNRYFTGNPCPKGHIAERYAGNSACVECHRERAKKHREENPEYHRQYRIENAEKLAEYDRQYYQENRESKLEYRRKWLEENPKYSNEYCRNRYANDEDFKCNRICRNILKRTLSAAQQDKDSSTFEILGYSAEDLKKNIESKFLEGMSWDNYSDWHIDHKVSVADYIRQGITDPSTINALDNLYPMWAEHNNSKNDKDFEEWLTENPYMLELYGHWLNKEEFIEYLEEIEE